MHVSLGRARFLVRTLALCLLAGAMVHGLAGCSHAGGRPPVDSPIYAFQPADPDDYTDDTDADDDSDSDTDSSDDGASDDGD
jgi:hypothetical protein